MFEFGDMNSGFHDFSSNKYTDSNPAVEFYVCDSIQDIISFDMRSELAANIYGSQEPSNQAYESSFLELDTGPIDGEVSLFEGTKWSGSTDYFYADVADCVNPNAVMPLIPTSLLNSPRTQVNFNTNYFRNGNSPPPSPKENKSHLTFSPHQIKVPPIQEIKRPSPLTTTIPADKNHVENVKKDLSSELTQGKSNSMPGTNTIKIAPGIGALTFSNNLTYNKLKQSNNVKMSASSNLKVIIKTEKASSPNCQTNNGNAVIGMQITNNTTGNLNKQSRSILLQNKSVAMNHSKSPNPSPVSNTVNVKTKLKNLSEENEYPKPAYSYSCLIAMALKNSRSGLLPVSEIYNFMCEHFPYFRTAPTGWKNSVRHNLSLNKCFQKIEKPATNGSQRKGCLWAMNPIKISKMEDEVQKWSKKDPMAIKKAMVCPENLGALERGEMKHGSTGDSDHENDTQSDTEEDNDLESENDTDETPESPTDEEEEVLDIYDTIGVKNDKKSIRVRVQKQNELLELTENNIHPTKRARLDVNYSISPTGVFEQRVHHHQQQQQQPNRRKMQLVSRIA